MLFYRLKTPKTFTVSEQNMPSPEPFPQFKQSPIQFLAAHPLKLKDLFKTATIIWLIIREYFHDKSLWFFMKIRFLKTKQEGGENHPNQNFTNRLGLS
jgi:hypothetical protein